MTHKEVICHRRPQKQDSVIIHNQVEKWYWSAQLSGHSPRIEKFNITSGYTNAVQQLEST